MAENSENQNEENVATSINLDAAAGLADNSIKPDPWYKRLGNGCLELLVKFGLFILGFLLDVLKALWKLFSGIFIYLYKFGLLIYHSARSVYRIFRDVDIWGRLSFLVSGLGPLHEGQVVDGIVYMLLEVLFILWMATTGKAALIGLNLQHPAKDGPQINLIVGLFTIVGIIAYAFVYVKSIQQMRDDYVIKHLYEFKSARKNSLYVLDNLGEFERELPTYYPSLAKKVLAKKNHPLHLADLSAHQVYHVMRHYYGYSALSAHFIAEVPFKRLAEHKDSPFMAKWKEFDHKVYLRYDTIRTKIRLSSWSNAFSRFLNYEPAKKEPRYGFEPVRKEVEAKLLALTHSYDKYNNYHSFVRDHKELVRVLGDPDEVIAAVTAEDHVSKANGVAPLGATYVTTDKKGRQVTKKNIFDAKHIMSREIGAFEMPFEIAKQVSELYVLAKKLSLKPAVPNASLKRRNGRLNPKALQGKEIRDILTAYRDFYEEEMKNFVADNLDFRLESVHGYRGAYDSYVQLRPFYDQGKAAFMSAIINAYHVDKKDAKKVYQDFDMVIKDSHDDEKTSKALMTLRGKRLDTYVTYHESLPFHGQPERFKRKVKSFADERFAVTILSLPTLGAIVTCLIPLIFSIFIAFTNWDYDHNARNFTWDVSSWGKLGGFFTGQIGPGSYSYTFVYLLQWTVIWAVVATFSNYFLGIILALLINRKSIKMKKMWRTIFVIAIAIPQFITLLTMSKVLADDGPINTAMQNWGWISEPWHFLSYATGDNVHNIYDMTLNNKITIILVNMWIGIPYTMLSTSGILMNIPEDLYESSRIDGAGPWKQLTSITMPYVFFVTGPSLLTTFIGNINNFNVIFFLTGGSANISGTLAQPAGGTDLLITWLYKLANTGNNMSQALASAIGILVFIICIFFSLMVYDKLGSVKNEEEFQ